MAEIKTIHGGQAPALSVNDEMVAYLERLLAEARSGELRGIALVPIRGHEFEVATHWFGEAGTRYPLAMGIHQLAFRYQWEEFSQRAVPEVPSPSA